jgi:hypothetical protein
VNKTLKMIRQGARGRKQTQRDRKNARQVKSKVKSMLVIFFTSMGLFTKVLSWLAKQSILHATVKFYGNCVKCEKTLP